MSVSACRNVRGLAVTAALLALAGCATPPPERFYSLSGGVPSVPTVPVAPSTPNAPGTPGTPADSTASAAPKTAGGVLYIELQAVSVPQQVSRSQLVVTSGPGRVELLEQERWSAPLASELGQALSLAVTGELGAIDVFRTPTPEQAAVYRISTNVQRFESAPGQYALIDAVWSVRRVGSSAVLTCRSVANEALPAGSGYDALVAGHRRAVRQVGADIAKAVRALAKSGQAGC
ncbi:PqiC family protein [Rugamonas sp. CCM 8940]|uniref:PqiC family protein n=1 Tax=Rugamonas sp. CCM 8940 TaxID=2765359 RepID=UPI0018F288F7|nr:PqiC family protein [Rugamonas sp. CCM 8940]MBJ7313802.1 membrane integrity-associated transporter subunit PqiC [Rugamonas sp. CCM 8940]